MHMRRIILTIGLLLAAILLLPVAVWFYYDIKFGRELEAKLAALKAQGMPITLAEAAPKPVPDDQNAAVLYQKVFNTSFVSEQPHNMEEGMAGLSWEEIELLDNYRKEPSAQLENEVRQLLARPAVRQALEIFWRGSQRPHCVFPVNWQDGLAALFPHMGRFREATRIVATQALLSANEGHIDEAIDWWQVALRMSEHAASEPTLIAQAVSHAMQDVTFNAVEQLLSSAKVAPSTADKLEAYLRQIETTKAFTDAMIGDRAMGCESFDWAYRQPFDFFEALDGVGVLEVPGPLEALYFSWLGRPLHKLDQLMYLEYMNRVIELIKLPFHRAKPQLVAQEASLEDLSIVQGVFTKILCPVYSRSWQKRDQAATNIGLCRVALALKAYKYERGIYPATLVQLQETLDWELPEDPFSGTDFVYTCQGKGFKLYSLGPDMDDDGGLPEYDNEGKWRGEDSDIVWECAS